VRIGSDTPGKIGLPETTIGMPLPVFGTELARDRLSKRHFTPATLLGTTYGPEQALDVGFLDRVEPVERLEPTVRELATHLAGTLSPAGFAMTRTNARQATIDHVLATLDEDMARFTVTPG
jgi:enoyl-CoA hydratase